MWFLEIPTYLCPIHYVLSIYVLCPIFLDIPTYPKIGHPLWTFPYLVLLASLILKLADQNKRLILWNEFRIHSFRIWVFDQIQLYYKLVHRASWVHCIIELHSVHGFPILYTDSLWTGRTRMLPPEAQYIYLDYTVRL